MATQPRVDRIEAIARLNDRARLGLDPTARIVITRSSTASGARAPWNGRGPVLSAPHPSLAPTGGPGTLVRARMTRTRSSRPRLARARLDRCFPMTRRSLGRDTRT